MHLASAYFSYSEANRAPTAIELGCADPTQPCNLPNALVADPPLKQVVARTFEAGIRSTGESKLKWSAGWFRAENTNDILFVASQQTGFGYFVNYGKTRRQGAEISLSGNYRWFTLGGNYTFLDATFQSRRRWAPPATARTTPGLGWKATFRLFRATRSRRRRATCSRPTSISIRRQSSPSIWISMQWDAPSPAATKTIWINRMESTISARAFHPAIGVTNLGAHYQVVKHLQFFVQIDNLFNHHYYTAAQLNTTPFDNAGQFHSAAFRVRTTMPFATRLSIRPARRRGAFGGMKITF